MERAEYKTTNGASRRTTPDAPERIGHPKRCTGHGPRTLDGGSARERVPTGATGAETRSRRATPDAPAKWLGPITSTAWNTNDSTLTKAKAFVSVLF